MTGIAGLGRHIAVARVRNRLVVLAVLLMAVSVPAQAATALKGFAMCRDEASLHRLVLASVDNDDAVVRDLMKRSCTVITRSHKVRVLARTKTLARIAWAKRGQWWTVVEAVR